MTPRLTNVMEFLTTVDGDQRVLCVSIRHTLSGPSDEVEAKWQYHVQRIAANRLQDTSALLWTGTGGLARVFERCVDVVTARYSLRDG